MVVKYKNYRRLSSDVKLLGDTEEVKDEKPASGAAHSTGTTGTKPVETKKDDVKKEEATKPKQRPRP